MALFSQCKVIARKNEAKTKSKIISRSARCQPASIKLDEFSYFRSFTHNIITQDRTKGNIMNFIGAIQQVRHLRTGRNWTKKAAKNEIERRVSHEAL